MSAVLQEPEVLSALDRARSEARTAGLPFSGSVSPQDAWLLLQGGHAALVDVRSPEERKFVGQIPGSLAVPWATGTSLSRNPRFTRELEAKVKKGDVVLLLCRSGKRSALAAEAAAKAGFSNVFNVSEGFEGELNQEHRRGHSGGWRFHGLPWTQD
jgi:rhodanese-related sulfurtransferase